MWKPSGTLAFVLCVLTSGTTDAQAPRPVFPAAAWEKINPQELGWSSPKLEEARKYFGTLPPASIVVVDRGRVVAEWGDPALRIKVSSIRKSLLSALYGIHVREGRFDLNENLAQLGIGDNPPLTTEEKRATLRMLLQARSGVYHPYVGGTPSMKAEQPVRGSHVPGTFWYYNNWDFNALGTIFERQLHSKIAVEFYNKIATPLQMQDFRVEDMYYLRASPDSQVSDRSIHPAYHFRLTERRGWRDQNRKLQWLRAVAYPCSRASCVHGGHRRPSPPMGILFFHLSGRRAVFPSPRLFSSPIICERRQRKPECTSRTGRGLDFTTCVTPKQLVGEQGESRTQDRSSNPSSREDSDDARSVRAGRRR
jgi:CubicO group peptidase (beta-lactamase class C family)